MNDEKRGSDLERARALAGASGELVNSAIGALEVTLKKLQSARAIYESLEGAGWTICASCMQPQASQPRTVVRVRGGRYELWICEECDAGAEVRREQR